MDEQLRRPYEGQLIKFTNVVKGWQTRWFLLDPETGTLEYYLAQSEHERRDRARGSIQLAGAVISPSDEDSNTFTVSPAVGEAYKLRAVDTRDRQMWLNRLRVVAEMHTRAIAHNNPPLAPREHRTRDSQVSSPPGMGLAVLDAFTQVAEHLEDAKKHHSSLSSTIEDLPSHGCVLRCIDRNLLLLKATSQATILCLEQCLGILQSQPLSSQYHQLQTTPSIGGRFGGARSSPHSSPRPSRSSRWLHRRPSDSASVPATARRGSSPIPTHMGSPLLRSSHSTRSRSSSHTSVAANHTLSFTSGMSSLGANRNNQVQGVAHKSLSANYIPTALVSPTASIKSMGQMTPPTQRHDRTGSNSSSIFSDSNVAVDSLMSPAIQRLSASPLKLSRHLDSLSHDSEVSDEETGGSGGTSGSEGEDGQKSVIMHLISQLRLGMDLTRVTLPTFILERRSLLEMFADFLGHPDYFLSIGEAPTPEKRMMALVRWYLTSIHVGRNGSVAKKPYNPIIGETFHCSWKVPVHATNSQMSENGTSGSGQNKFVKIRFMAEQVSHHPPVSAFFIECPEREMCINAHIWTKSKFLGMSVGVNLVGDITLVLGGYRESYSLAMPSAFARSILTEPWVELGGQVNVSCPESSCRAAIIFHTKPFYGGKLHKVTAEVKDRSGALLSRAQGEWDSVVEFAYTNGDTEVIDVRQIPMACHKRVKPLSHQLPLESRRLWHDVSVALSRGDVDTATGHKCALEERQRAEERARGDALFPTQWFVAPRVDHWQYHKLPSYAFVTCLPT